MRSYTVAVVVQGKNRPSLPRGTVDFLSKPGEFVSLPKRRWLERSPPCLVSAALSAVPECAISR